MGKRRKPSPKPNYQSIADIQEDTAMRMASDAMTDDDVIEALGETVLAELRGEVALDSAMQDAMDYLPERKANLAAFIDQSSDKGKAYVSRLMNPENYTLEDRIGVISGIENQLSELGRLQGNVPMPIVRPRDRRDSKGDLVKGETRVHTEYDINPVTGLEEVVPFVDPKNPNNALRSYTGVYDRNTMGGFDEAIESLMNNALQLAYRQPSGANASKTVHRADLRVDDGTSLGRPIDVEATANTRAGKGVVPMQAYTFLDRPNEIMKDLMHGGKRKWSGTKDEAMFKEDVVGTIQRVASQNNINEMQAVERLVSEGFLANRLANGVPIRQGKLFKGEMQNKFGGLGVKNSEDLMEGIVQPGYNDYGVYKHGDNHRKTLVQAPDTLHMTNLKKAKDALLSGDQSMIIDLARRVNYRSDGEGSARMRMYYDIPYAHPSVTDMSVAYPLTQQVLSKGAMEKRRIA